MGARDSMEVRTSEVSVLPGGLTLTTVRASRPGPTVALLAGVHGDEDEGVLAAAQVLQQLPAVLTAGVVRVVAPANPPAWATASRESPLDGGNLARSFPGDPSGGPTSVIAAAITEHVINGADLLIDLHSAGRNYTSALFCGFVTAADADVVKRSEAAAVAFDTPFVWQHPECVPGRTLSTAVERGVAAIYAECGGRGGISAYELDAYVSGVVSVLADLAMLPDRYRRPPSDQAWWYGGGDFDRGATSTHHGFFVPSVDAGVEVGAEDEVARVYGFDGKHLDTVIAPHGGPIAFIRHQARVQAGDMLYVMAERVGRQP